MWVYFATCFVYAGSPGVGRGSQKGCGLRAGLGPAKAVRVTPQIWEKCPTCLAVVAPAHVSGPSTEPSSNERDNHEPNVGI